MPATIHSEAYYYHGLLLLSVQASFPGRSHRITSGMKYSGWGKAWEIWSHACHQVAHGGWCPMKNIDVLSCTSRPNAGSQSVRKADELYQSLFTMPLTDRCKTGHIWLGTASVSTNCLPDVITCDQISHGPGLLPTVIISYWKR